MASVEQIEASMRVHPGGVRFNELQKVCEYYFGPPRQNGSHVKFKMPWAGDPRINIQNDKGRAKAYQVRQVLSAINRLKREVEE